MEAIFYYDTPIGVVGIAENGRTVTRFTFGRRPSDSGLEQKRTPLLDRAAEQLQEYFEGRRRAFDIPLEPAGTPFQVAVWDALREIPYGQTRTYGQIAEAVGNPKGSRAVGLANNRNPIAIFIPCHRVIGADGTLTGYAGGLDVKRKLLQLEQDKGLFD